MSDSPRRNGWTIAKLIGDKTPDRTQRLLNRACWDEAAAMGAVRRFAVAGLDEAARRSGRGRGLAVGALDETGQEKHGSATAGVQRQHMGCAGGVENGISTVHLSYVREGTGHALIGARQWIPAGQIADPVRSLLMALPPDLQFATKGQLARAILADALADGVRVGFVCADEVYGSCTELRDYLEEQGQAYVLRVPSNFRVTLARDVTLTCAQAVRQLMSDDRRWEIRSAGKGSKGDRWYAWACIAATSPRALPADPPPHPDRRAGLPLLLCSRGPAARHDPPDPRRRAPVAGGRGLRVRQGRASGSISPRSASTMRSSGTPSWSWQPWPSAP